MRDSRVESSADSMRTRTAAKGCFERTGKKVRRRGRRNDDELRAVLGRTVKIRASDTRNEKGWV